jgi:hypothetical protein
MSPKPKNVEVAKSTAGELGSNELGVVVIDNRR